MLIKFTQNGQTLAEVSEQVVKVNFITYRDMLTDVNDVTDVNDTDNVNDVNENEVIVIDLSEIYTGSVDHFKLIIQFAELYEQGFNSTTQTFESDKHKDILAQHFQDKWSHLEFTHLYKLMNLLDYMNSPYLLDLCAKHIADELKGKTSEEMATILGF